MNFYLYLVSLFIQAFTVLGLGVEFIHHWMKSNMYLMLGCALIGSLVGAFTVVEAIRWVPWT